MKKDSGFTLIEVMIVIAVVAILASIAFPSYQNSVRKSCRNDGKAALLDIVSLQEKYYFRNNSYSANFDSFNYPDVTGTSFTSPEGCYTITLENTIGGTNCVVASDTGDDTLKCFTVLAEALGDQENDTQCQEFRLSSNGKKEALNEAGTDATDVCW